MTANGQSQTVTGNSVKFQNITGPSVSVSIVVTVGRNSSDPITNEFQIEQPTTTQEQTTRQSETTTENNRRNDSNNEQTTQERRNR